MVLINIVSLLRYLVEYKDSSVNGLKKTYFFASNTTFCY